MIHESYFFAPDKNINSSKGENLRIEQKKKVKEEKETGTRNW